MTSIEASPPVANPPTPDVDAISALIDEALGTHDMRRARKDRLVSALTAHTASLREKVEVLERERNNWKHQYEVAVGNGHYVEGAMAQAASRMRAAEADANRMREALEKAEDILSRAPFSPAPSWSTKDGEVHPMTAITELRAAISPRPADEPVTLGER